ncbi:MAG: AbrB/MazE/SpoVT family DNA-binding domain-containing protein [Patescibacteria group bacterium]|jgi:AbrB family looped-hinge helix DNA binding protein
MFNPPKMFIYGSGTMGQRGQIVIPAKARKALDIKPNEEFIFFGHGRVIHIIRAFELDSVLEKMASSFTKNISKFKQQMKGKLA